MNKQKYTHHAYVIKKKNSFINATIFFFLTNSFFRRCPIYRHSKDDVGGCEKNHEYVSRYHDKNRIN